MASLDFGDGDKKSRDILDLSNVTIRSDSELKKWLEKVPDFKIRPEKVRAEDVNPGGEDGLDSAGGSPARHEAGRAAASATPYPFCDPIPTSMKDVCIKELGRVNISWRMLTVARPKNKLEEDIFSRLVQLEKLQYKTVIWENEQEALKESKGGSGPFSFRAATSRGRGGRASGGRGASMKAAVTERRVQTCKECGEEFCSGTCKKYLYDDHARTLNPVSDDIFKTVQRKKGKKSSSGVGKKAVGADAEADQCADEASLDQREELTAGATTASPIRPLTTKAEAKMAVQVQTADCLPQTAANGTGEERIDAAPVAKEKGARPKLRRTGKKANKSKKR